MSAEKKEDKTIPQIIEEVKCAICDNYCKYPFEIADEELLRVICDKCPLNKLEDEYGKQQKTN